MKTSHNIALFGGTFNPVHNGHVAMTQAALEEGIERVIVMPCWLSPHKLAQKNSPQLASPHHRMSMLEIAFKDVNGVELSDYELSRAEPSLTRDTVEYLLQQYPEAELHLILGWDQFIVLETWVDFSSWGNKVSFIVFRRQVDGDHPIAPSFTKDLTYQISDKEILSISSTEIRGYASDGKKLAGALSKDVTEYIQRHQLY